MQREHDRGRTRAEWVEGGERIRDLAASLGAGEDAVPPAWLGGAQEALALRADDGLVALAPVAWRSRGLAAAHLGFREALVGPVLFSRREEGATGGDPMASAIRAILREIVFGDRPWHYVTLRLHTGQDRLVGAAATYASIHRLPCSVTFHTPSASAQAFERPYVPCEIRVRIYDASWKGRAARRLEGAGEEIPSCDPTPTVRREGVPDEEIEQLQFVLDIASRVPREVEMKAEAAKVDMVFREASEDEMYPALLSFGENLRLVERSLRQGDRCIVGEVDGRIVFHMWASESPGGLARLYPEWILRRKSVHGYDSHTAPEFRGMSVYPAALRWFIVEERKRGVEQILGQAAVWNQPAIRAIEKLGFVRLEEVARPPE